MAEFKEFDDSHLDKILELCNRSMDFDTLNETILREKIIDDSDFDPALILSLWENGGLYTLLLINAS